MVTVSMRDAETKGRGNVDYDGGGCSLFGIESGFGSEISWIRIIDSINKFDCLIQFFQPSFHFLSSY